MSYLQLSDKRRDWQSCPKNLIRNVTGELETINELYVIKLITRRDIM